MSAPTNHYKLGLFVIVGLAAALLVGALFGATRFRTTVRYHSYFNESVEGLALGSPVKFRGVTIGHVAAIEIAPDHRMVDVVSELDSAEVKRMGLAEAGHEHGRVRFSIPPDLRAQLGSKGITGVKFISIDFFDVASTPTPDLPFDVPVDRYIPAAPSMMKNLEDTVTKALERLPDMVDAVVMIMARIDRLAARLEDQDVSGKFVGTLDHADDVMSSLQHAIEGIDRQDLGGKAAAAITDLNVGVNKLSKVLDRLDGERGLLASTQRATDTFGDVGREARGTQQDLGAALRDVSEVAQAIRSLLDSLENDPDMLLKGKTKRKAVR